jgi:hypothetical protein
MAFLNRVLLIVPGFGQPVQNDALFLKTANALGVGSTTVSLSGLTPAVKDGWIRLKIYGGTAGSTLTSVVVQLTDGTTTETCYGTTITGSPSVVAPAQTVLTIPFLSELAVTQVNVIVVIGTAVAVLDVEVGASN